MKRAVKRKVRMHKNTKTGQFKTFEDGYELGNKLVESWNSQPNPQKVYINGYRIHHGLVGTLLGIAGAIFEKPAVTGLGTRLAIDDISDMPNWLNFERNDSAQYNQTYLPSNYNGFA